MNVEKPQTIEQRQNKRQKLLRKIVNTARDIITYEVGLSVGVRKLDKYLVWIEQEGLSMNFPVFRQYNLAVVAIPSGKERLNSSLEALNRYDELLHPINLVYQPRILGACLKIIHTYSTEEGNVAPL